MTVVELLFIVLSLVSDLSHQSGLTINVLVMRDSELDYKFCWLCQILVAYVTLLVYIECNTVCLQI